MSVLNGLPVVNYLFPSQLFQQWKAAREISVVISSKPSICSRSYANNILYIYVQTLYLLGSERWQLHNGEFEASLEA